MRPVSMPPWIERPAHSAGTAIRRYRNGPAGCTPSPTPWFATLARTPSW
jgi:hypothetical protein